MQDNIRKICQKTLLIVAFAGCMGCSSAQETTASATIAQESQEAGQLRQWLQTIQRCSCREYDSRCSNSCAADQYSGISFFDCRNNSCCI